jgi:hypothetical protein
MNILTKEAINDLLDTWANVGTDEARALAPKYGVKPAYVRKLACLHGVKAKRKEPKVATDPRWQWAIERGAVLA